MVRYPPFHPSGSPEQARVVVDSPVVSTPLLRCRGAFLLGVALHLIVNMVMANEMF